MGLEVVHVLPVVDRYTERNVMGFVLLVVCGKMEQLHFSRRINVIIHEQEGWTHTQLSGQCQPSDTKEASQYTIREPASYWLVAAEAVEGTWQRKACDCQVVRARVNQVLATALTERCARVEVVRPCSRGQRGQSTVASHAPQEPGTSIILRKDCM